jgi:hypothetical protein
LQERTSNHLKQVLITYEDITEQKLLNIIFDVPSQTSPVAFFVVQEGKFICANPQDYSDTGLTQMEIIGKDSRIFIHPEDKEMVRERGIRIASQIFHKLSLAGQFP